MLSTITNPSVAPSNQNAHTFSLRLASEFEYVQVQSWAHYTLLRDQSLLIGLEQGRIITYAQCSWYSSEESIRVCLIETHPAFRRRGYARQLLGFLQDAPAVAHILALDVDRNTAAFWQRLGFSVREHTSGLTRDAGDYEWWCWG